MPERKLEKNTVLCCVIFLVYAVLTFIGAASHEMWIDEAQAWVIVRDNDIKGLFNVLGYEGHPPLWYMILYIPAHMGLPCTIMPFISWFITAAAGALIMFKAPFHIAVKASVLFSGGFLFLNSVMSRSYCLINLFIVLIAIVYPHRKKYPVLYGFLIALMANTHICVSGFIGIIGIFMIFDLFRGFRTNGTKQNIKELTGLAVAGVGVLVMVIPLIGSVSLNATTNGLTLSAKDIIAAFPNGLTNIARNTITYTAHGDRFGGNENAAEYILSGVIAAAFVIMMILFRHKTRPFLMIIFFWLFYTITVEMIVNTMPNRALIFVTMFFAVAWIAESEPENNASEMWSKLNLKTETKAIRRLVEFIESSDRNFRHSYLAIAAAIMLFSVPSGAYYLFSDYGKTFCPAKAAAEYMKNNFPEDSVFITVEESCADISAYFPECKLYSLEYGRFYTYWSHEVIEAEADNEQIYNDLRDYDNLYYIDVETDIDFFSGRVNSVYSLREGMVYGRNYCFLEISEVNITKENIEISV